MEELLIDVATMCRVAGMVGINGRIPDGTMLCALRNLAEKNHLRERNFQALQTHLDTY